jgi:hypothetical protein
LQEGPSASQQKKEFCGRKVDGGCPT